MKPFWDFSIFIPRRVAEGGYCFFFSFVCTIQRCEQIREYSIYRPVEIGFQTEKIGTKLEIAAEPNMLSWIRHCMAEVCAPPSALLVLFVLL